MVRGCYKNGRSELAFQKQHWYQTFIRQSVDALGELSSPIIPRVCIDSFS